MLMNGKDLCCKLVQQILKLSLTILPDNISTLDSPAKKQWLMLHVTCTMFRDILLLCSNPFQMFALSFDTRVETHGSTLCRLENWSILTDSLLTPTSFKVSLSISFYALDHFSREAVHAVFTPLKKDRVLRALNILHIKLAPGYHSENHFPLDLPNLTQLYLKLSDHNVHGPRHPTAFIINCPNINHFSLNSNNPCAQYVVNPRSLNTLCIDFSDIGFMLAEGTNLSEALYGKDKLFSHFTSIAENLTNLEICIRWNWLVGVKQLSFPSLSTISIRAIGIYVSKSPLNVKLLTPKLQVAELLLSNTDCIEVFTVPLVFRTESVRTPHGLHGLFGLSADSTRTLLGILLAEHPANFTFLVLVQS
jgi:hypothetical protein